MVELKLNLLGKKNGNVKEATECLDLEEHVLCMVTDIFLWSSRQHVDQHVMRNLYLNY